MQSPEHLRFLSLLLASVVLAGTFTNSNLRAEVPVDGAKSNDPVAKERRSQIVLKAIAEADQIPDERGRATAQWRIVQPLVELELNDLAMQQALKLRTSNPQTCIYSLTTIGVEALKRGDNADAEKAWNAAMEVNTNAARRFDHYVIELCFKLKRPLNDAIEIALKADAEGKNSRFCDVRNELAARGRVDEAYRIAQKYLTTIPKTIHDREIAYRCASAEQLVANAPLDHFEQAIRIIQQMPTGEHRDFVIASLNENLLMVSNRKSVPEDRIARAEHWVQQIHDESKRALARRQILRQRLPALGVADLERKLTEVTSREEKDEILSWIFRARLDAGELQDADAIFAKRIQLIKDQPRPESKSKFGSFSDDDAIRLLTWTHEQDMVRALIKAGRKDDARIRLEAMKDLPDAPARIFFGNLASVRQALYMEMGDFDSFEKVVAGRTDPAKRAVGLAAFASRLIENGQREKGLLLVERVLEMSPAELFPTPTQPLFFTTEPYRQLVESLMKLDRTDQVQRLLNKFPENERTADLFEAFGGMLVRTGQDEELDRWLDRLPHHTARAETCLGAFRELSQVK